MIPHQLQLKNFLSYGATLQTIDFDPYHLIYLSGKNGHGKSALLEALTWLIWGLARKTLTSVKPDQGLIRLGQTHMMVIGQFSCNNQLYRIRREVTIQNNKAHLQLEFGLLNKANNRWIPLTEKTTRDTQAKIESVIGLSYDSFINSAFLKQGSANEFSKKSAKERKEVFATILGLGLYDTIRTKALQKAKIEQMRITTLDTFINKIDQTVAIQKETALLYTQIQSERILNQQKINDILNHYNNTEQEYNRLKEKAHQQELIEEDRLKMIHDLNCITHQIKTEFIGLKKEQKKTAYYSLHHYLKQHGDLINQLNEQQKLQTDQIAIQKEIITLEMIVNQAEALKNSHMHEVTQLLAAHDQLMSQKNSYAEQLKKIPSEQEYASLEIEYNQVDQKKKFLEKCLEQRKTIYQSLIAKRNYLTTAITQIADKQALISSQAGQDPACPLCSQNLSLNRKKFLQISLEKEEAITQKTVEKVKKILPILKEKIIKLHEKTVTIQTEMAAKKHLLQICQIQKQQEQALLQEYEHLSQKEQALKIIIEEQNNKMNREWNDVHSQYQKQKRLKEELVERLAQIPYNEKEHQILHNRFLGLSEILNQQEHRLKETKQTRESLLLMCAQARKIKDSLALIQTSIDVTTKQHCDESKHALDVIKEQINLAQEEKERLDNRYFELKTLLAHYDTLLKEKTAICQEKELITSAIRDYQIIAHATGKDGLQALLIEEAIPDIEHDANMLLSKLTNNQTQLFIESLKDLKNGGTKETLDIKISDNMGIRPYEMFSGGEAFRIDLALRIAISKLLAKRAGTALQTLIIDEGFGSQDEEGLGAIMDAMYKIQDDFEKIIVVSHLPAMKDQFPVHFIVEKKPQGSVIQVKELC